MKWRNMLKDIQKASPLLLTIIGVAGVVGTAVLTAKCTPKAMKAIEEKQKTNTEPLKPLEKAVAAAPAYLPAIGVGSLTIFAIISSNHLSCKQNLSLAATCTLLQRNYKEYRSKVKELFGAEADHKVVEEVSKGHFVPEDIKKCEKPTMEQIFLWCEPNTMQWFEATKADVLMAEYEVNHVFSKRMYVTLADYIKILQDTTGAKLVNDESYENTGWSIDDFVENWDPDQQWIEFYHNDVMFPEEDCPPYIIIETPIDPGWDFALERRPEVDLKIDDQGCYAFDVR